MSTILKALRRLEEEKSRGATSRPLREEVASGPGEVPRRRRSWLPVVAMLIGAGLGASAWWVWPYERGGEPVREAEAAAPATQVEESIVTRRIPPGFNDAAAKVENEFHELAQAGRPEDAYDPSEELLVEDPVAAGGPPEDAFASPVEVVERPAPEPRIAPVAPGAPQKRVILDPAHLANEPPAVTSRRAKRAADQAEAQAPRIAAATTPMPVTATPDPVADPPPPHPLEQQPPPKPRVEPAPAAPLEKPAARVEPPKPAPRPAPERVVAKKSAPAAVSQASDADSAVRVKRTQWHPEPARRSADIAVSGKSESVHEGDVVGDYVVTEIRPSGVVLSRDGQRIERGIGQAP
ncbi:MAG TPA: hypothetical protein VNF72_07975 [Myxococcota bacterium]|nr:hypothetical protein [Myxococcota bacterium]